MEAIYPMALFPTLEVRDIAASVDWYTRILDFKLVYRMQDDAGRPCLAHLRRLKHQDILLAPRRLPDAAEAGLGVAITLAFSVEPVDRIAEFDAFAARIVRAGADIVEGPVDRPWNTRELAVRDPDGYRLVFTTPDFARMRDFEATMAIVREAQAGSGPKGP